MMAIEVTDAMVEAARDAYTWDDPVGEPTHFRSMKAALAAALAAAPDPWREIETAPRVNGHEVMLTAYNGVFPAEWWENRWQTDDGFTYEPDEPTHWMPMPAPPKSKDS